MTIELIPLSQNVPTPTTLSLAGGAAAVQCSHCLCMNYATAPFDVDAKKMGAKVEHASDIRRREERDAS